MNILVFTKWVAANPGGRTPIVGDGMDIDLSKIPLR
jgi:hypothetical protein